MKTSIPASELRLALLKDNRGVYGLGFNIPQPAESAIITRPDKVEPVKTITAYQMIVPGHSAFSHTKEQSLFSDLHWAMLERSGIRAKCDGLWNNLWGQGENNPDQERNRRSYHGLKKLARRVLNHLIAEALSVADQQALAVARRFPVKFRAELYPAFCRLGTRAIQLADTFPALGLLFFTTAYRCTFPNGQTNDERTRAIREEGRNMILRGARLKLIAEMAGIPIALRAVKPRAAELALEPLWMNSFGVGHHRVFTERVKTHFRHGQ